MIDPDELGLSAVALTEDLLTSVSAVPASTDAALANSFDRSRPFDEVPELSNDETLPLLVAR